MGLLTKFGLSRKNQWERPTLLDKVFDSPLQALVFYLFNLILFLRGKPVKPPGGKQPIRIVCISDTHDLAVSVPDGDLLIHAGDLTNAGTVADIQKQIDWLDSQPHNHKVFVAGNHDSYFDMNSRKEEDVLGRRKIDYKSLHYLENSSVTLKFRDGRRLKLYGAPDIPECGGSDFAFQYKRDAPPWKGKIPLDIDILITHAPPRYHLDLGLGCGGLLQEIWRVKPKLHVFGHVHWGRGKQPVYFDECQRVYERVMSRQKKGLIRDFLPNPGWIDLVKLVLYGAKSIVWQWIMLGPSHASGNLMINAAQMYGNTGKLRSPSEVQTIEL